jgi:peptidoglycan hydrolase-like protein with peptidoglycan-binding domain
MGSSGSAVSDLQEALDTLGFDPGEIDGVFGEDTRSAVIAFQQSKAISADGVVGPTTWLNINEADQSRPMLQQGSEGLPVRLLQSRLSAAGFAVGDVDGVFGSNTDAAVRELQRQAELATDGIVGPRTWAAVDAIVGTG